MHLFTCTLSESTTGVHFHFWLLCLFEALLPSQQLLSHVSWIEVNSSPYFRVSGWEGGGGGKCPPIVFFRGMSGSRMIGPSSEFCHNRSVCIKNLPVIIITMLFLKKRWEYCNAVPPLCYLLLNHLTNSNQTWCVSYSQELGRGQKVKYNKISVTKSISKIFIPDFVCVRTNKRYKTYWMGFPFYCLGHAPEKWDFGGARGGQ